MTQNMSSYIKKMFSDIVIVGGKGGVGKTTVASAIALQTANDGKKTLLFSIDPSHSLSDIFGQEIGDQIKNIHGTKNLYAQEIDSKKQLDDLKKKYRSSVSSVWSKIKKGVILPFDSEIVKNASDLAPPGLDDVLSLSKLLKILDDDSFEKIVIDTAAGLHAIRLLQMPEIMNQWSKQILVTMKNGGIYVDEFHNLVKAVMDDAERLRELFANKLKTEFLLVTIPEKMSIAVTNEMKKQLDVLNIECNSVIVNHSRLQTTECNFCNTKYSNVDEKIRMINGFESENIFSVFHMNAVNRQRLENLQFSIFEKNNELFSRPVTFEPNCYETKITIYDKTELIIFGGKGGCGKTTCSASVGLHESKNGKNVLIISTDPQKSLSDIFEQKIGNEISKIKNMDNLSVIEIDAKKSLDEFRKKYQKIIMRIISDATYLPERDLDKFIEFTLPGMDEVMALIEVTKIIKTGNYDLIILDTAPTGHTLKLLNLPQQMQRWVDLLYKMRTKNRYIIKNLVGRNFKDDEDIFLETFSENLSKIHSKILEKSTKLVLVTRPDELSFNETVKFYDEITSKKINCDTIICNGILNHNYKCGFCADEKNHQQKIISKLNEKFQENILVQVPLFPYEINGLKNLEEFKKCLCK